jgi:hypothetical protein
MQQESRLCKFQTEFGFWGYVQLSREHLLEGTVHVAQQQL